MNNDIICVKCGGRAAEEEKSLTLLSAETAALSKRTPVIFVHGGGAAVSALSRTLGLEPVFRDGIRLTSPEEMDVVDMVLGGKMNTALVRKLCAAGTRAVGITGCDAATFTGRPISPGSQTGKITVCDPGLIRSLIDTGYLPVMASTSMTADGTALNINADEAALAVSAAVGASVLLFLSDIPGILKGGEVIRVLKASDAEKEIASGVISGGMIPKVRSSRDALEKGVGKVIIGQYSEKGDLERLLSGEIGTAIVP